MPMQAAGSRERNWRRLDGDRLLVDAHNDGGKDAKLIDDGTFTDDEMRGGQAQRPSAASSLMPMSSAARRRWLTRAGPAT